MASKEDDPLVKALSRIAEALERFSPPESSLPDWSEAPAFISDAHDVRALDTIVAPPLALLRGIDAQKQLVRENVDRLARGAPAHDMLLWGSRGMGKSALVRAAVADVRDVPDRDIALVQLASDQLDQLPGLFDALSANSRRFVLFLDDLAFAEDDTVGPRNLRSVLEGGVEARPDNVRIAVTSNRRAILARQANESDESLNPRDTKDDKLALADRFGLSVGFHDCPKPIYLEIVGAYAESLGLDWNEEEALEWAMQRGSRSGRSAWQFITEIAGRSS